MLSTPKAIARLAAKVQTYEVHSSAFQALTPSDMAMVLADPGLDEMARYLARVKWAHQVGFLPMLFSEINTWLRYKAERKHWKDLTPELANRLAALALREMEIVRLEPTERGLTFTVGRELCPKCGGRKYVYSKKFSKVFVCRRCMDDEGTPTGRIIWKPHRRAVVCEIHHQTWQRNWEHRYQSLKDKLKACNRGIYDAVHRRLGEMTLEDLQDRHGEK